MASLFVELAQPGEEQQASRQTARGDQQGQPRLLQPNRLQVELRALDLESLLPQDHRARLVWGYVERQDLSRVIEAVKARGANAGRAAIDPRILFALWLYATLEGVGSGREVARLCQVHDAYRWICGGVSVNYHALNDFRSSNEALMDELLSDNVAALAAAGAITLKRVAQDGMRVRADAGAASFRRHGRLQEHLAQASELVQTLKQQARSDPAASQRKAQAAQLRAARERQERIQAALAQLPEVAAVKKRTGSKHEARVSTTDADARVMKMGDGGFRPAYNVQLATTCQEQIIIGLDVVSVGSDMAQLAPMVSQIEQRLGQSPDQWLVDGGFAAHGQIEAVADKTEVYAPVPEPKTRKDEQGNELPQDTDKHQPKAGDSPAVACWRQRMATDAAKEIYKERAASAECVNALARNRGMQRMPVRGLSKVRAVVGLYVLAHNMMRMAKLLPGLIGWGPGASAITGQTAREGEIWRKTPKSTPGASIRRVDDDRQARNACACHVPRRRWQQDGRLRQISKNSQSLRKHELALVHTGPLRSRAKGHQSAVRRSNRDQTEIPNSAIKSSTYEVLMREHWDATAEP